MEKNPALIYHETLPGCVTVEDCAPRVEVWLTVTATGDEEEQDGVTLALDGKHGGKSVGMAVYFKDAKSWRKFVAAVEAELATRE